MVADIFGASPGQTLKNHAGVVHKCASKLGKFFDAAIGGDWEAVSALHSSIVALEQDADDTKKQFRLHLPRSLFMPVPREDLLELLLVQDRIANQARDVADVVHSRRLEIPQQIAQQFRNFVQRNIDAARQARNSVRELD